MWRFDEDNSDAIITAGKHIISSHKGEGIVKLPPKAVIFCIGSGIDYLKRNFNTKTIIDRLPKFIGGSECLIINEYPNICFTHGGYGSPAIADTVETLIALGVKSINLIGMCGGFSDKVNVGDVIIPKRVLSEEGTSLHYYKNIDFVPQSEIMVLKAIKYFEKYFIVHTFDTVTTDAIYRQTFYKEEYWRRLGCAGIEMEASAFLSVSKYCGVESNVILLISDKHPVNQDNNAWEWGNLDFDIIKEKFISRSIKYTIDNP